MSTSRALAYALIAVGAVGLLSRLSADAGWLWVALVAAGLIAGYLRTRTYAFLVLGALLAGAAVGILLEGNWNWPGAFLVSLGAGAAAIDVVEPRTNRWPRWLGASLALLGVVTGLAEVGFFGSSVVAVLLIVAGALLVWRGRAPVGSGAGEAPLPQRPAAPGSGAPSPRAPGAGAPSTGAPGRAPHAAAPRTSAAAATAGATGAQAADREAADPRAAAPATDLPAALRAWRRDTAAREGRVEALVLPDVTLEALIERRPTTREALAEVWGIGPVKLERYGDALLELLRRA